MGIEGPIDYHLFKERNAAMTVPFDTLGYATKLEQAGVPAAQAAEEAKILADVLSSPVGFPGDVAALASSLAAKIEAAELKLENRLAVMASNMHRQKWMLGTSIVISVAVLVKLYFE